MTPLVLLLLALNYGAVGAAIAFFTLRDASGFTRSHIVKVYVLMVLSWPTVLLAWAIFCGIVKLQDRRAPR